MSEFFGRGQVIWAVWQLFLHVRYDDPRRGDPNVPSEFEARVRKLWAFGIPIPAGERPGAGTSVEYTHYHAFELAVAMMLMDLGLNQSTVANFINDNRVTLQQGFKRWQSDGEPLFIVFSDQEIKEGRLLLRKGVNIWVGVNVWNREELFTDLDTLRGRGLVVLEIGRIASRVAEYLSNAPKVRRGRR